MAKRKQSKRKVKQRPVRMERPASVTGETQARLFDRVAEETLHGDRDLFDTLTAYERSLVVQWLSEAIITGDVQNAVHNVLWEIDFDRKPVDIETFITDPYYLGKMCEGLDQHWVDDLKKVFAPGSQVFEWVMTGAIGIGKTTLAMIALAFKLQYLAHLRDAPRYYGLLADSLIVFGIYSITKLQVSDTGYYKLRGFIDSSPYFRHEFPRSQKIDSQLDFERSVGKRIKVVPGSQDLHALGLDLYSFSMDEVNFMRQKVDKDRGKMVGQAYELYNAVHTRIRSRFIRPGGSVPGIMLLMSSRNAQTSFLESHLKKSQGSPHTFVSDYALWEVKSTKKFTLPKFNVEVGDRLASSRILEDGERTRPEARIIAVPGEFRDPFMEDIDQALRDIAGIATFNVSPLIRDRKSVYDMVRKNIRNPFTTKVISLDILDDVTLDQYFDVNKTSKIVRGKWTPRLNPERPRYIHVDLSLSGDCAGLAMGHVSGLVKHNRSNADGTVVRLESPFIIMDLMLRILPPVGSEIELAKIRSFILYLKSLYPIARVTFDGFQSADSLQILKKVHKIDAGLLSVDRTDEAYLALRSALFERRIGGYAYEPFMDEVLDVERDVKKRKVDHPARATKGGKGSKDVADAVAGVTWLCINDERSMQSGPMLPVEDSARRSSVVIDPDAEPEPVAAAAAAKKGRRIGGHTYSRDVLRNNVHVP